MKDSHGSKQEKRVYESSDSASCTCENQDNTEIEFSIDVVTDLTGNKSEERVWNGVNESDKETIPVLELWIGSGNLEDWVTSHLTKSGVTIGIVETLSLPLDHNTSQESEEKHEVCITWLEEALVNFFLGLHLAADEGFVLVVVIRSLRSYIIA